MNTETFFEYQNIQHEKTWMFTVGKFYRSFLKIKGIQRGLEKVLVYHSVVAGVSKLLAIKGRSTLTPKFVTIVKRFA